MSAANKKHPSWCVVGAELLDRRLPERRVTILKLYANGNVTVSNYSGQFRVSWGDQKYIRQANREYGRGQTFDLVTPELLAEINEEKHLNSARMALFEESDRLAHLARNVRNDPDAVIAEAERIWSRQKEDSRGVEPGEQP